jgi:hypothetical protein
MQPAVSPSRLLAATMPFIVAAVLVSGSCASDERGPTWVADSTAYVATLDRWLRDSAVVDSVTRTVDITELVAAIRTMVKAPQPLNEMPTVSCARRRIFWDHGSLAADAAMAKAQDSVIRLLGEKAFADATARTPASALVEGAPYGTCRGKRPEPLRSVGGTRLDAQDPRPMPPRGWPK